VLHRVIRITPAALPLPRTPMMNQRIAHYGGGSRHNRSSGPGALFGHRTGGLVGRLQAISAAGKFVTLQPCDTVRVASVPCGLF